MVWNDVSRMMMIIIILLVVVHFPTLGTAFAGLPTSSTRTITTTTKHPWKRQVWENPELSNFSLEKLGTTVVEEGKEQRIAASPRRRQGSEDDDDDTSNLWRPSSPEVTDYVVSTTLPRTAATTATMSDDKPSSSTLLGNGDDDDDDSNYKNKAVVTSSSRFRSTPMVRKANNPFDVEEEDEEDVEDIPSSTTQRPTFVLEKKKTTTTQTSSSTPPRTTPMNGDAFWKEKAKEHQDAWQASIFRATEKKRQKASQWWNATTTKSMEFLTRETLSFGNDDKNAVDDDDDDDDNDSITETAQGANVLLERLQFWKKAQKDTEEAAENDVIDTSSTTRINGDKDADSSSPLKSTPKYGRTATTQEPFVSSSLGGRSNGVDKETLDQYEDWKEQRKVVAEQVNVIPNTNQKNDDTTTPVGTRTASTTTTTRNQSTPQQRRRPDPEKFQNPDQTIVVQAIRGEDDGRSNADKKKDSYSSDFVSGRAVPRSPTSRVKIPRPFFIESPSDLFFIDIGEAAMIQSEISMIVSSSSSTKIPVNQGVAGASAVSTTTTNIHATTTATGSGNNWESGPYEYQVTSYRVDDDEDHHDEPTSWLGRLVDTLRRDRIQSSTTQANARNSGEDDYREFTVRRMPAERSSRDGRYARRAAVVAKRRGRRRPLSAPPPTNTAAYYYHYNARSRSRIRRRMGGSSSGGVTLMGEDTLSDRLPRPPNYVERLPPQQHNYYYGSAVPPSNQPKWQRLEDDFELPRRSQQPPRGPRGRRPPRPPSDYYYPPPRF